MQFDYVVTLCEKVVGSCLDFARDGHTLHWHCADPDEASGTEEERLAAFRLVRDEIRGHLNAWLSEMSA